MAMPTCFRLLMHWARRAASRAAWTAGNSKAINTAMIAMTTSNSMSVNPLRWRVMADLSSLGVGPDEIQQGSEWPRFRDASDRVGESKRAGRGAMTVGAGPGSPLGDDVTWTS